MDELKTKFALLRAGRRWEGITTSGLTIAPDGSLRLEPAAAELASGWLHADPLDAGAGAGWNRLRVEAAVPDGAAIEVEVAVADTAAPPAAADFAPVPALDSLLPRLPAPAGRAATAPRWLWLRVRLSSDGRAAPRLEQIQAETEGASYLEHLPAVYARRDERGTLHRTLELFRSMLGDLEWTLESVPRRLEPTLAPDADLAWLASWLAFEPPAGASPDAVRDLLARVPALYTRRGTRAGLAEQAEIETGIRPQLLEPFAKRAIWSLGESALGIDTATVAALPDGIIVSGAPLGAVEAQPASDYGAPLFREDAHRFVVVVPAAAVHEPARRQALLDVLDAEKPAHTDYHLCVIGPAMRVGIQAAVGIDSIVGSEPCNGLDGARLGLDARLADEAGETNSGRVGTRAFLGRDTVLG